MRPSHLARPLLVWGPLPAEECVAEIASLGAFRAAVSGFEGNSVQIDADPGVVLRSPELHDFELIRRIARPSGAAPLPDDVRKLLGWTEAQARTMGAYPWLR